MKKVVYFVWTALCVLGAIFLFRFLMFGTNYSGSNITLSASDKYQLKINAESANFEAVSGRFFVLRHPSGDLIAGTLTEIPLGWDVDEYYVAGPLEVQGGVWIIEKGRDITIRITSSEGINVQLAPQPEGGFLVFVLAVLVGVVVLLIGLKLLS